MTAARRPGALRAASDAVAAQLTGQGRFAAFDATVTNLGVVDLGARRAVNARSLTPPVVFSALGEITVGAATLQGELMITVVGYTDSSTFADDVVAVLGTVAAARRPRRSAAGRGRRAG